MYSLRKETLSPIRSSNFSSSIKSLRNLFYGIPFGVDINGDGISDGWTYNNNGITIATPSIEDGAQKLSVANASTASSSITMSKTSNPCKVNNIIIMKVKYKTNNCYFRVSVLSQPSNNMLGYTTVNLESEGAYTEFVYTFNAIPLGETSFNVIVAARAKNIGDTGDVWVKDIKLYIKS